MLNNIRIVLVETSHPGNIGAAARAMKVMGLSRLYLVRPTLFPALEANVRACGAEDILKQAVICHDLDTALLDCELVVATTARRRSIACSPISPRQCAQMIINQTTSTEAALVFGRESSGLTNAELDCSQMQVIIPTGQHFSSLNLAAAVQILSYELHLAVIANSTNEDSPAPIIPIKQCPLERPANFQELNSFYQHLHSVLLDSGFASRTNPTLIMRRLRCLFDRARPTLRELNTLRGIFKKIGKPVDSAD